VNDFWKQLKKPIMALAPMEDVTDAAFRRIIAGKGRPASTRGGQSRRVEDEAGEPTRGGPYVTFCEFTSADGLALADEKGQKKLRRKLLYSDIERPIVAQFFTATPEHMVYASKLARAMGFDGVDINMGCPDRAVEKSGCGAAMIKNPKLAREIIRAAKGGFGGPVSVKTRLGYNTDTLDEWLPEILAEEPAAITVHARTRKEMSLVPARWERVKRAVEIRDQLKSNALILGNGDLKDLNDAKEKVAATGADGALLGRAIFGNPWLFADRADAPTPEERMQTLAEHIKLFNELMGDVQNFAVMKKHFKSYISGWDGAKDLRMRLMETATASEAVAVLKGDLPAQD